MIKLLIGGSPCTYWSVAQKKGREVEAKGLGWELFKNYLIAKEKFKPDLFLYENNKSAAQPIKDQISRELGVDLMHINSALVSAQNRQRFYAFNWNVDQPADRGIMLKDILETTTSEKGYELRAPAVGVGCRNRREDDGKLYRREVIIHILMGALKDVPRDEEIVVLSMYDGIGTGRYCLDKMGFTNVTYYAYEIDKPAMTVALSNYPDIIQLGDAFDLRRDDWELGKRFDHEDASAAEPLQDDDQTTDLSSAPAEIKEAILKNDQALSLREADPPENCVDAEEQPKPSATTDCQCVTAVDILLDLRDERLRLSQINGKNRRYGDEVRALEYAIDILEAVT